MLTHVSYYKNMQNMTADEAFKIGSRNTFIGKTSQENEDTI